MPSSERDLPGSSVDHQFGGEVADTQNAGQPETASAPKDADPPRIESSEGPAGRSVWRGVVSSVISTLMTLGCLLAMAVTVGSAVGWYRLDVVLSGSMEPGFMPGDVVYAQSVPRENLRPGDVMLFAPPPEYGAQKVMHRVSGLSVSPTGVLSVQTKGDANDSVDPWNAKVTTAEVWVVKASMPKIGFVAVWAKNWWPLLVAAAVCIPMGSTGWRYMRESQQHAHIRTPDTETTPVDHPGLTVQAFTGDGSALTGDPDVAGMPTGRGWRWWASLLWLAPTVVTLGAGAWMATGGDGVAQRITETARSWQSNDTQKIVVPDHEFTVLVGTVHTSKGVNLSAIAATGSPVDTLTTTGGRIIRAVDLPPTPTDVRRREITVTGGTTTSNPLTDAIRVTVRACEVKWVFTAAESICEGEPRTLVRGEPLMSRTVALRDDPTIGPHLIVELFVKNEDISAAGHQAEIEVRVDTSTEE